MALMYNKGLASILNGDVDLLTDTLKVMLVTSSYTADPDHDFVTNGAADATDPAAQELSGTGYSRKTLSSKAINTDDTNDRAEFDAGNVTWTGINAGTAQAAIIFNDTGADATSILLAYVDTGGFPAATNGGDLTITWSSEGIFYI